MVSTKTWIVAIVLLVTSTAGWGQTTRPATPSSEKIPSADKMLEQLLGPARNAPILPEPDDRPKTNQASLRSVGLQSEAQNLIREGTYIFDKVGRLTRTPDGQPEFTFEIDGQAMKDPPMLILPNLKLMTMEDIVKRTGRSPKFRITAMVTEYGSRNYVLIEKVTVPPEPGLIIQPRREKEDNTAGTR